MIHFQVLMIFQMVEIAETRFVLTFHMDELATLKLHYNLPELLDYKSYLTHF